MKHKKAFILLLSVITFSGPLFLYGQGDGNTGNQRKLLHEETPDDPYLPNAYNNEKLSPAYKYTNTIEPKLQTTIFTNQANVSSSGQNIIGDAANEPNIAVDPLNADNIVIGWRQFDNVISNFRQAGWSYTSDAGQSWTFPGVIQPGIFRSDPVLDYDSAGNFYYNSLTSSSAFFCRVFRSNDGGASWDNGVDAAGGDKQWMTIDRTSGEGSGNIYSSWTSSYSSCLPGFFTRSTDGGNSYESCTEVDGEPFWGTMAVGTNGELYITGGDDNGYVQVVKSINAQVPGSAIDWFAPASVFMDGYLSSGQPVNPAGLLGQVNIDVDRSDGPGQGNVYVLASLSRISNGDPGDVMFARSTDGGATWSAPVKINDDPSENNTQWLGTMSVAPNGRIDAVWLDTRDGTAGSDWSSLFYSYSIDGGISWTVNEKLSPDFDPHVGYPNQDKMGDYFDMVSDNTGAHLAWANTLNDEEDVYYSYIIPALGVAVNEISQGGSISVFPNPTKGILFIHESETNLAGSYRVEIYTLQGEKVFSQTSNQTSLEADISSQPAGIYIVKVVQQDGLTVVKKIVRE
jgi:hypothetical protein